MQQQRAAVISRKSGYNPYRFARRVRFDMQDGQLVKFVSKSFTQASPENRYRPTVDLATGQCDCNCGHYTYRLAGLRPTVYSKPEHLCKHLLRAVAAFKRQRCEVKPVPATKLAPVTCPACHGAGVVEAGITELCLSCIGRGTV